MDSQDRTCVVTGASRGIGRGIAKELASEGATVVVNYHSDGPAARSVAEEVRDLGGEALVVQADVADRDAVASMADEVYEAVGLPDVVVNNAGITLDAPFETMRQEEWERVLRVNLTGAFNVAQEFFPAVRDADEGRLVNISSVVGKQGNYGQANYATAKSGLFGFTRSLALELAPHDSTANCVAPGYTRTDMVESVRDDIQERLRDQIPLDRFADVEEIAAVVGFLAGRDSSYITGEVIDVNGGMDL